MIKRIQQYILTPFRFEPKQFHYIRPAKDDVKRVVRAVIVKHQEALKELSDR